MVRSTPAGDLLRTMSHELRTPLNGIIGYAQLLLRDKTLSPRQVTSIGAILESGDALLALINNLVDLARAEAGEPLIILGTVSLRSLIASFTVHDTGRGIAASRLESIIRPFGRVPGDATLVKDGGLGLALGRELVRLMGGELEVSSELGVGSIFRFAIDSPNPCGDGGQ